MADDFDRAADLQSLSNDRALALHAARPVVVARADCADCGDVIPAARAVLGVARCVPCQVLVERAGRR